MFTLTLLPLMMGLWHLIAASSAGGWAVRFSDVTEKSGVAFQHIHGGGGRDPQKYFIETMGSGAAFGDYDGDGDLDLYAITGYDLTGRQSGVIATNVLYRNNGDGTFTDVSKAIGIFNPDGKGMGMACADYDDDGWADIFVANDQVI